MVGVDSDFVLDSETFCCLVFVLNNVVCSSDFVDGVFVSPSFELPCDVFRKLDSFLNIIDNNLELKK